ncbi:MAG: DUF3052 domain-containing protein [Propionibacterium sp.]|nr:DUF3052 domain-containing protein [Propionibacterium sp.]
MTPPGGPIVLGLSAGQMVQELGWDSDVDEDVRTRIMEAVEGDLVEEVDDAVDVVLLWWRSDDGDLVDALVDSLTDLTPDGYVWVLTPKVGRPGAVDPADLAEAVSTAGMALTSTVAAGPDWQAHRVVRPRNGRR